MGNSVSTWKKYYARHLKKRRLQDGIDSFESDFLAAGEDCDDLSSESKKMELPCSISHARGPKTTFSTMNDHGLLIPMDVSPMSEIEGDSLGRW